jgi:phenylacetate-CoA ligase
VRRFTAVEYVRACAAAALVAPAILARPYVSRDRWRAYQTRRVAKLLRHAWEHTAFYRRTYEAAGVSPADFRRIEDLARFPTVTKAELVDAMLRGELGTSRSGIESVSSGSSGRVITVTHRVSDTHAYAAGRYRILDMTGALRPWSRTMNIYTSAFPASSFFGLYRSWFVPTIHDLDDTIARLRDVRPHVLGVYPSRLVEIAARLERRDARALGIRLISVNSEMSTRAQRDAMADHFGCPVLEEYSTEELGWTAAECVAGAMHVWEDMAYLETLRPDSDASVVAGEPGEVVGTNLHNFATPFIRYRQGDSASLHESRCACGRTFRTLRHLVGRCNDAFHFSGGVASSAFLLDTVYSLLLDDRLPIADFCLVQDGRDSVRFQYSLSATHEPTPSLDARIVARLSSLLPAGVTVGAELTAHMHKTTSGKRNPIVSLVGRDEREPAMAGAE